MHQPPYPIFPTIKDEYVLLRQIEATDIADLLGISFYDSVPANTILEASAMQDRINEDYANGNSIHWGIVDCLTGKIVGTCGYYRGFDKSSGELGCVLLPKYQGQGYMTAAMLLAIKFGLAEMGLKRIWAATAQNNIKAISLLERLNFKKMNNLDHHEVEYELKIHPY